MPEPTEQQVVLYGYSERGMINALCDDILYSELPLSTLTSLLTWCKFPFQTAGSPDFSNITKATILVEQGFSDFGDLDLLFLLDHGDNRKQSVLLEAKVRTERIQDQWQAFLAYLGGDKEKRSTLFVQLYRKMRLIHQVNNRAIHLRGDAVAERWSLGKNRVVSKAAKLLENYRSSPWYIALVPDRPGTVAQFYEKTLRTFAPSMNLPEWTADNINRWGYLTWPELDAHCQADEVAWRRTVGNFDWNKHQIYEIDAGKNRDRNHARSRDVNAEHRPTERVQQTPRVSIVQHAAQPRSTQMKVAKVLLRWYKSFNVNYTSYPDHRSGGSARPWNLLGGLSDNEDDFPFIEIPLEDDITTVVGANESGKSHLLSAIRKVLTGEGIPDEKEKPGSYARTDLCHYTSPRSRNADDWPHIGLQFRGLTQEDLLKIGAASGSTSIGKKVLSERSRLTLILAPDKDNTVAYLYLDNDSNDGSLDKDARQPILLDENKLREVRECLPQVEFIKSKLAISDQVPISNLLAAYAEEEARETFDYKAAQQVAKFIHSLDLTSDDSEESEDGVGEKLAEVVQNLRDWKKKLNKAVLGDKAELELSLFRDVMEITADTLRHVSELSLNDRTYADSLTAKWNKEIDERLNLSHYWQQDDSFALRVNYKQGIIFFEITDKTGATYTFRERSSGLRYFLSYYIQAKALEMTSRKRRNAIVLMDEPDSFLSIRGQRNLLAIFESLVRPESSGQSCQLVYTTHSPFLINKNYPHRLRGVRKGDAEEGTQLIDKAMLRRYEPVRSALGIDCAQTLVMAATNVVMQGPTDQYLLTELVRQFIRPENVTELLDLNSVVAVSAESASSVEKLLVASQWGDEPVPATVVLLDSNDAGNETKAKITGNRNGCKQLVEEQFVLQLGHVIAEATGGQKIVTTEDILTPKVFAEAVVRYAKRWHPEKCSDLENRIREDTAKPEFAQEGLVEGATKTLHDLFGDPSQSFDRMGVLHEVVHLLVDQPSGLEEEIREVRKRLFTLCHEVRRAVSASQQAARRNTGKQSIQRLVDDFFKTHKESSSVFEVRDLLIRIQGETYLLGEDAENLDASLKRLLNELNRDRPDEQQHFRGEVWQRWKGVIGTIRKNPLEASVEITEAGPISVSSSGDGFAKPEPKNHDRDSQQRQPAAAT